MGARSQLRSLGQRSHLHYGEIICARCGTACDFEESSVGGDILARAYCHGEVADIKVTFSSLRLAREQGVKLEVFQAETVPATLEEDVSQPLKLLTMGEV